MNTILTEIEEEISRLERVKELLGGKSGRKPTTKKKRYLSPEARARISDAQKRRWAKRKKK